MTGREELPEGKAKGNALAPSSACGHEKARLGSPAGAGGLRSKGFAITDLLGLEAELQPPAGSSCEGGGPAAGRGGGGGGGAPLPLGLGFLCGFATQQPAGAPRLLPAHLPFLQPRSEHQHQHPRYGPEAEKPKLTVSGKRFRP